MFGVIGATVALVMFGFSALANLYNAGRFSGAKAKPQIRLAKDVRNTAFVSFFLDVVIIAVILLT